MKSMLTRRAAEYAAAQEKYRKYLITGDEPDDLDAILNTLGKSVEQVGEDIKRTRWRQERVALIDAAKDAGDQCVAIEAEAARRNVVEAERRERFQQSQVELLASAGVHRAAHSSAEKARKELRETSDPALLRKESELEAALFAARKAKREATGIKAALEAVRQQFLAVV